MKGFFQKIKITTRKDGDEKKDVTNNWMHTPCSAPMIERRVSSKEWMSCTNGSQKMMKRLRREKDCLSNNEK